MLSKPTHPHGTLTTPTEVLKVHVTLTTTHIHFISTTEERKFNIKKIKNLRFAKKSLYFSLKSEFHFEAEKESELAQIICEIMDKFGEVVAECETKHDNKIVDLNVYKLNKEKYLKIENENKIVLFENVKEMDWEVENKNVLFGKQIKIEFLDNLDLLGVIAHFQSKTEFDNNLMTCNRENVFEDIEPAFDESMNDNAIFDESITDSTVFDKSNIDNQFGVTNQNDLISSKNNKMMIKDRNAYVSRGETIGIFENGEDFLAAIKNVGIVEKMVGSEERVILKGPGSEIRVLDLGRGEVVERWDVERNVRDLSNDSGLLVGVGKKEVFRIDPRCEKKVVQSKEYKSGADFSCVGADDHGTIVVGSENGEMRIYGEVGKRARVRTTGFCEKPRSVEISPSGEFLIATFKEFLVLYVLENQKVKNQIRLCLKDQHIAFIKEELNFTAAKFSAANDIVTSTGCYVVSWSVRDILNGDVDNYIIKKYDDVIVENDFIDVNNIVVTLPDDVCKITKSKMGREFK